MYEPRKATSTKSSMRKNRYKMLPDARILSEWIYHKILRKVIFCGKIYGFMTAFASLCTILIEVNYKIWQFFLRSELFFKTAVEVENISDLICASEIARIYGIEAYAFFFPMRKNCREIAGKIPYRIPGKTCRMGGKHRWRKYGALRPAGWNDGKRNCSRALSHAGNVLYR